MCMRHVLDDVRFIPLKFTFLVVQMICTQYFKMVHHDHIQKLQHKQVLITPGTRMQHTHEIPTLKSLDIWREVNPQSIP